MCVCSFTESDVTSSSCPDGETARGIHRTITIFKAGEKCEEAYGVQYVITEISLECEGLPLGE